MKNLPHLAKTQADVQELKEDWRRDPIWDIEDTEGFEAYKDELLTYRKETEAIWDEETNKKLLNKAEKMGVPGNTELAKYIENLENQIEQLAKKILIN